EDCRPIGKVFPSLDAILDATEDARRPDREPSPAGCHEIARALREPRPQERADCIRHHRRDQREHVKRGAQPEHLDQRAENRDRSATRFMVSRNEASSASRLLRSPSSSTLTITSSKKRSTGSLSGASDLSIAV